MAYTRSWREIPLSEEPHASVIEVLEDSGDINDLSPEQAAHYSSCIQCREYVNASNLPQGDGEVGGISSTTLSSLRTKLLNLHNQARANAGKPALQMGSTLNTIAQNWASEMAAKNYFSADAYHTRPDGTCWARWTLKVFPEAWRCKSYSGCTLSNCPRLAGENIARRYNTAAGVFNAWMASPSHYKNIMNRDFRHCGIGIQDARNGDRYWAVEFLTDPR